MKIWEDDLNARLKGRELPPKYWEFPELEKGDIHKHCAKCFDINCTRKMDFGNANNDEAEENGDIMGGMFSEPDPDEACAIMKCRWNCGMIYHSCKTSEHSYICPNFVEPDEFEWMLRGTTNLDTRKISVK